MIEAGKMKAHLYFPKETKEIFERAAQTDYYLQSSVEDCEVLSEAYILPPRKMFDPEYHIYYLGGVADKEKKFVEASALRRKDKSGALVGGYDFDDMDVVRQDIDILYAGVIINHFGHFLLEGMSRLWYWVENRDKNLDIAFLMLKNQKIFPQFWELMDVLGIPKSKIHIIKEPTQFNTVYVPKQAHVLDVCLTDKFLVPYQYMVQQMPDQKKEKIYLSRGKLKKGTECLGEKHIQKLFTDNGYKIMYPEQMSVREQITAIKNASSIAGVSGTAMHLAVFADCGTRVTVLERTDVLVPEQYLINQAIGAKASYIAVNVNPFPVDHSVGPVLLSVTPELAEYCKDNDYKVDEKYVEYVKPADAKRFVKKYMELYTQLDNNDYLAQHYSLCARRMLCLSGGFIPFLKLIKQKIKAWKRARKK